MKLKDTLVYIRDGINEGSALRESFVGDNSTKDVEMNRLRYWGNTETWEAGIDGKKIVLVNTSESNRKWRIEPASGFSQGPWRSSKTTSWLDFSVIDYHTITHRPVVNFEQREESFVIPGRESDTRVTGIFQGKQATWYQVSLQCVDGKTIKQRFEKEKTSETNDGIDRNSFKTTTTNLTITVRDETTARRLVNAMKHAVTMHHGGKIPAAPRKAPAGKEARDLT